MLSASDYALHDALGITAAMLDRVQVQRVTDREARDLLSLNTRTGKLDGLLYPYLDPQRQQRVTYRLRRDYPEFENGKPKNKYLSPYGDRRYLYFGAATIEALAAIEVPIIVVEAEKSVLAIACAAEQQARPVLPIGLGGCWGWRGRIGKVDTPNGGRADEVGPLPDFDRIAWMNRDVVVALDANASTNVKVQAARRALSLELAARGARVRILDLSPEHDINGPDDFVGRHGAARFFAAIDAAPDAATFDAIFRLNRQHAVVCEGKTIVITETHDPVLDRRVLLRSSFTDFRNRYLSETMRVGKTLRPLGHVWLAHPDRRQYAGVVMSPDREVPGYLNLWRGFAVPPVAGSCQRFKNHLYEIICSGNATLYDYVFGWMAAAVQHPARPAETALVLRGGRGAGKGIAARTFGELFGQHYLQIANTKHLVGNFNAHLQDTIVLFADEAFWAGDKASESVLKMLITEPVIPIERKGHDVTVAKNLLHIIMASNHEWVVPAGLDERRFCVLDIDPGHQNDHAYFAAIRQELDHGGREALLHDLQHHPIGDLNLREVPQTEALREQKVLSLPANERWLFDKLMAGRWLPEHEAWQSLVLKDQLHTDYVVSLQKLGVERRRTETELGMFITKMLGAAAGAKRKLIGDRLRQVWEFSDLQTCRSAFDRAMHGRQPWPSDE